MKPKGTRPFRGRRVLAPDAVLVFAERELPLKSRALLVYGAKQSDAATLQTAKELRELGFETVEIALFGFDDKPDDLKIEVGPARWEIIGCSG